MDIIWIIHNDEFIYGFDMKLLQRRVIFKNFYWALLMMFSFGVVLPPHALPHSAPGAVYSQHQDASAPQLPISGSSILETALVRPIVFQILSREADAAANASPPQTPHPAGSVASPAPSAPSPRPASFTIFWNISTGFNPIWFIRLETKSRRISYRKFMVKYDRT